MVLAILATIATFAAPQVLKYLGQAKSDAARVQIQNLSSVLDLYRLEVGSYPAQDVGLTALVERPPGSETWTGPYLKKRDALTDPWGKPYLYRFPGQHGDYDLFSLGADNAEGGEGENQDLTSW